MPEHLTSSKKQKKALMGSTYGRFVYRFRWLILAFWLVIILICLPLAANVTTVLQNSGYSIATSESSKVDKQLVNKLHHPPTQVLVLFQANRALFSDPAYRQEVQGFISRARRFSHVTTVVEGSASRDGHSTFVAIGFNQDKDTVAERMPDFHQILPSSGPAQVFLTGDSVITNEIRLDTQSDTEFAEMIAIPLTLLVLLIVFGTVVAGIIPLVLAGISVSMTLAAIYLIGQHTTASIYVQSIVSILGLGLSIDYSLFVIRRFREELARGAGVPEAIAITVATAGEAILYSGLIVIIGFAGLLFIGIDLMTSFSIGGIAVAFSAVLAALTLLPALLSIIGTRINALRLPRFAHHTKRSTNKETRAQVSFWRRWAFLVMRRPALAVIAVMLVLIGLGWPARTLNPGLPGVTDLPAASEARHGLDILHQQFPAVNDDPIYMIVRSENGSSMLTAQNVRRLKTLSTWIGGQAHITRVEGLTELPPTPGTSVLNSAQLVLLYSTGAYRNVPALSALVDSTTVGDTTLLTIKVDTRAGTSTDQAVIDRLRAIDGQVKTGLITQVGGARVVDLDFNRVLYSNFVRTLLFILVATFALLLITFRSVVLPLKAILMNIISISAAYGALVFVFQDGHFEQLLGFTSDGFIDRLVPILLFCVLFGLSMDYEVFLLARVREEWLRTGDNRASVALGLEKTGGVITNAALLFVIVSGAFIVTKLIVTRELGLGITVAILVDASIIRCVLVPASMQLLGTWNWWYPGQERRRHKQARALEPEQAIWTVPTIPLPQSALAMSWESNPGSVEMTYVLSGRERELDRAWKQHRAQLAVIEETLRSIFAQVLQVPQERIQLTSDFFYLGGNASLLPLLLARIEQVFRVRLTREDVSTHATLLRLAAIIYERRQEMIY